MYIHVVRLGETIGSIANLYGVSVEEIIVNNGLEAMPHLIVGQSLIIIAEQVVYTVMAGDTLFTIGLKFNMAYGRIASFNNLGDQDKIYVGMDLAIPQLDLAHRPIEVNGYIVPDNPEADMAMVARAGPYLTSIIPSNYTVNPDGSLNPLNDGAIIGGALAYDIAPVMSVSNAGETNFDPELGHAIFINREVQDILFNNILNIMIAKGYSGLNINFERLFPEDRDLYNEFLRRAVNFFHQYNYTVSTALVPKTYDMTSGEWWGAHDYRTQGEILDFVIVMTYDWGCVACPPLAIAPIYEVARVLDYAVSVIPKEKISMGIPLYGFDWTLPFQAGDRANLVDYLSALELALAHGVAIEYDPVAQAPFFNYTDSEGRDHIVWYEDARSLYAKYSLLDEYGLRGASYWSLNSSAPQNWPLVGGMFNIIKNVFVNSSIKPYNIK